MFKLFIISSPTKKIKEPTKFDGSVRKGEHFMSDTGVQSWVLFEIQLPMDFIGHVSDHAYSTICKSCWQNLPNRNSVSFVSYS